MRGETRDECAERSARRTGHAEHRASVLACQAAEICVERKKRGRGGGRGKERGKQNGKSRRKFKRLSRSRVKKTERERERRGRKWERGQSAIQTFGGAGRSNGKTGSALVKETRKDGDFYRRDIVRRDERSSRQRVIARGVGGGGGERGGGRDKFHKCAVKSQSSTGRQQIKDGRTRTCVHVEEDVAKRKRKNVQLSAKRTN